MKAYKKIGRLTHCLGFVSTPGIRYNLPHLLFDLNKKEIDQTNELSTTRKSTKITGHEITGKQ